MENHRILFKSMRTPEDRFEFFKQFFPKETCHLSAVTKSFWEACQNHMAEWALNEVNSNSLELFLHHAHLSRHNPWKEIGLHPLVKSITWGRINHVKIILDYGFNLEYTEHVYEDLLSNVECYLEVKPSMSSKCKNKLREIPNRNRIFWVLLVIRAYNFAGCFQECSEGCDAALKEIWRHSPHSFLCKEEFLNVLEPYTGNMNALKSFYRRYCTKVCSITPDGILQPFSLAHYSRCKVRQVMGENMMLPSGVESLPIPSVLKSYLLFR